jgi:hypothetical protein
MPNVQTPFDMINLLQQQLDRMDTNISFKKEMLLRGVLSDSVASQIRTDIRDIEQQRQVVSEQVLKIKLDNNL